MTSFEEVYTGLHIARNVCREEALLIGKLLTDVPEQVWDYSDYGFDRLRRGTEDSYPQINSAITSLAGVGSEHIQADPNVMFSRYPVRQNGDWHGDPPFFIPVNVVYLLDIDDPTFEYHVGEPKYDERGLKLDPVDDVRSLTVAAGDILKVTDPDLLHRGLNPTDDFRYIGVLYP